MTNATADHTPKVETPPPAYAELQATTNFSFLRGASHAEELVKTAMERGLSAIAVTDRNTLAGVVRAHVAAKDAAAKKTKEEGKDQAAETDEDFRLVIGARLDLEDAPSLLVYPRDRAAYGRLCRLLSLGQGRADKGKCILRLEDVAAHAEGQIFIALPPGDWDWREMSADAQPDHPTAPMQTAKILHFDRTHVLSDDVDSPPPLRGRWRVAPEGGLEMPSARLQGEGRPNTKPTKIVIPDAARPPTAEAARDPSNRGAIRDPGEPASQLERTSGSRLSPQESGSSGMTSNEETLQSALTRIKAALGQTAPLYLAASHTYKGDDRARIAALANLGERCATPIVATNDVLYHVPTRRPLQDVLTCIREKTTLEEAGLRLEANAERHLKSPAEMARLFKGHEAALALTLDIVEACTFSLAELKYEYPDEPVPPGKTPQEHLAALAYAGAEHHFPDGVPEKVSKALKKELQLIEELKFAPYFLTVHDIVAFARSENILCQGRGSAANSVVCYCLGITAVNPVEVDLLFERFISSARKEPPDIDVDFEHERREEVIQWIYKRYGRDRAGLAATVISYRSRSAVRDVGKVFGLSEDSIAALAGMVWGIDASGVPPARHVRGAGLDPTDPTLAAAMLLAQQLMGFPRHLSQHVGGFVLTRGPLIEVVPVGNAAMDDRTFIEWDKDDIAALGLMKVDVLALGMLTCIRKAFELIEKHHGRKLTLATVPRDDEKTYDMLCKADSLGVFQVESRAQMNMLPRLKPRNLYDLVIEVAIVRPGPIQGDMVHPYLRRRSGTEKVVYPSPSPTKGDRDELRKILGKTLGVPLFQEQAMRIAMVAAEFDDEEVSNLRRAMATFRRVGTIGLLEDKMISKMVERGYDKDFATRCFSQIKGFGEYGFPESHAASFALLVYVSAWIKCRYPAAFACALLNSQPMGFYAPAQIVRDAEEHGVEVRAADVTFSAWDSTLEDITLEAPHPDPPPSRRREGSERSARLSSPLAGEVARSAGGGTSTVALRLGLRQIDGFKEDEAKTIVAVRNAFSPGPEEQARWQTSAPASFASTRRKQNAWSGNACAEKSSEAVASVGSIPSAPISSTSFVSNGSSSSRSTAVSMERKTAEDVTRPEPNGSELAAIVSSASGTETCASTSTAPLRQSSDILCRARPDLISENSTPTFTPTPALGGEREVRDRYGFPPPLRGRWRAAPEGGQPEGGQPEGGHLRIEDFATARGVKVPTLEKLAAADAFRSLGLDRRQALWQVKALANAAPLPLFSWGEARDTGAEADVRLPEMALSEHVVNDYQTLRLSLKAHPMSFLREDFRRARVLSCAEMRAMNNGARVAVAGVVLVRQRPGSAQGVVFMTIEDETGIANAVVWPKMLEKYRKVVMTARLIQIEGRIQKQVEEKADIIHIVSAKLVDRSDWLLRLSEWAADMKAPLANADDRLNSGSCAAHQDPDQPRDGDRRLHPRFSREPKPHHPRNVRVIPKSRDFH